MLSVVPHAGTWIEMTLLRTLATRVAVVPLAGTWIEIVEMKDGKTLEESRSPRGNVD